MWETSKMSSLPPIFAIGRSILLLSTYQGQVHTHPPTHTHTHAQTHHHAHTPANILCCFLHKKIMRCHRSHSNVAVSHPAWQNIFSPKMLTRRYKDIKGSREEGGGLDRGGFLGCTFSHQFEREWSCGLFISLAFLVHVFIHNSKKEQGGKQHPKMKQKSGEGTHKGTRFLPLSRNYWHPNSYRSDTQRRSLRRDSAGYHSWACATTFSFQDAALLCLKY